MDTAKMDLEKQVLPYFSDRGIGIDYYQKENDALLLISKNPTYFTFLNYIPKGTRTTLPTVQDSMNEKNGISRLSTGEWVVENIYEVKDASLDVFQKIIKPYK